MNPYLVIICCLDDSTWLKYANITNNTFFDVMCIYGGSLPLMATHYEKHSTYFYHQGQGSNKQSNAAIKAALQTMKSKQLFEKYKYIWVPSPNIEMDSEMVKLMFLHANHLNLHLAHPAVIPKNIAPTHVIQQYMQYTQNTQKQKSGRTYSQFLNTTPTRTAFKSIAVVEQLPQHHVDHLRIMSAIYPVCPLYSSLFLEHLTDKLFLNPAFTILLTVDGLSAILKHELNDFTSSVIPTKHKQDTPSHHWGSKDIVLFDFIYATVHSTPNTDTDESTSLIQTSNIFRQYQQLFHTRVSTIPIYNIATTNLSKEPGKSFYQLVISFMNIDTTGGTAIKTFLSAYTCNNHTDTILMNHRDRTLRWVFNQPGNKTQYPVKYPVKYTIAIIRNPLDRFIAAFHHYNETNTGPFQKYTTPQDLLDDPSTMQSLISSPLYKEFNPMHLATVDGTLVADYIVDHDSLQHDMTALMHTLSIQPIIDVSKDNPSAAHGSVLKYYHEDVVLYKHIVSTKDAINKQGLVKFSYMTQYIVVHIPHANCRHFWHHMMGEFMPVMSYIVKMKPRHVVLFNRDRPWNQPFDQFYRDVSNSHLQFHFVNHNNKQAFHDPLHYAPHYDITNMNWDYEMTPHDKHSFVSTIEWLKLDALRHANKPKTNPYKHILVQVRENTQQLTEYFTKTKVGVNNSYGSARRNVKDFNKMGDLFTRNGFTSQVIAMDGKHLYDQIFPYIDQTSLWLIHGAGMFFSLFMQDKSTIVEIISAKKVNEFNGAARGMKRIAKIKSFTLERIILNNNESIFSIHLNYYIKNVFVKLLNKFVY